MIPRKACDERAADSEGENALDLAAMHAQPKSMEMILLEVANIDVNSVDNKEYTPLTCAVVVMMNSPHGNKARLAEEEYNCRQRKVMQILLENNMVDVNYVPTNPLESLDKSALKMAVKTGRVGLVELLLERDDIDVNAGTPFGEAVCIRANQEHIVEIILARSDIQ